MSGDKPEDGRLRLFYALWPDEATRKALAKWRHVLKGRLVPVHNLHITLAFLGNQPAHLLPDLRSALESLDSPPMTLRMDILGHFSRSRVAWAGMSVIPAELQQLHDTLQQELKRGDIRYDEHPQFVPHLTLARDAARPGDVAVEPVEWLADHVALVVSPMNGSPYRLLASKRLTRS